MTRRRYFRQASGFPGAHNRRNLAAAAAAAWCAGADPARLGKALAGFGGVEHRLEIFAEHAGVRWCNDSAATVPQATAAALAAFDEPMILITGGTDKCLDFTPVREPTERPGHNPAGWHRHR
jgi:UDP-N-acetylmuramoylalanine--D-glutamate ligase